jgi:hypothetical protein
VPVLVWKQSLAATGGKVALEFRPFEIKTIRLKT